jgi:di/tricarboxylate transporter
LILLHLVCFLHALLAGAFGIARAMTRTGVAKTLSDDMLGAFEWMGDIGPLAAIYLTTVILTALLSNGASVSLVYPIAKAMAKTTGNSRFHERLKALQILKSFISLHSHVTCDVM